MLVAEHRRHVMLVMALIFPKRRLTLSPARGEPELEPRRHDHRWRPAGQSFRGQSRVEELVRAAFKLRELGSERPRVGPKIPVTKPGEFDPLTGTVVQRDATLPELLCCVPLGGAGSCARHRWDSSWTRAPFPDSVG